MNFFRLIKPDWAKPLLDNGNANPKFIKEIKGPNTFEGLNLTPEYLKSKNDEGYNIYFFPNHPSKDIYAEGAKSMGGKHVDVFNFVFVDMDLKDQVYKDKEEFLQKVRQFPLKPTMVVDSGHGIHAYWHVQNLTRDEYVFASLALLKFFKTDESVFTVCQLMRYPGYRNTKNMNEEIWAKVLDQECDGSKSYTLAEFPQEIFQSLDKNELKRGQSHLDRLDGKLTINAPEFVNIDEVPDTFFEFIAEDKHAEALKLWMDPKGATGDRSKSDMKLANMLFKNNFNRKEALMVISNTQKALSHPNRKHYAELTVNKVYSEKLNSKFLTIGQRNRLGSSDQNLGALVKCSWWVDTSVLGEPWRKRELTGLIAGPGVGKTTVTLKWIKDTIENNPDNDDVYVFFSLEMSVGSIQKRWNKLVGQDSPLADRLYVIANKTEDGTPRNIGLQEIYEDCTELKKLTGKSIGMVAIDHVGIISKHIDCRKVKYTFGIDSEINAGFGNIKALSMNKLCDQLKPLSEMIDTHIVVLTQTTKEKGVGDLPIGKDGAYGISNYENIMDRIITVWQPLQLVQAQTKTKFLAWQYVKIREKSEKDRIQVNEAKLMTFDLVTGDIRLTSPEEYQEFNRLYPQTIEMRDAMTKKKGGIGYSILSPERLNTLKSQLGLVPNTGDNNAVGSVQPNQHARVNQ